jgi:hypothetical protein
VDAAAPGSMLAKPWLQAIRDAGRDEFGQWGERSMFKGHRKKEGIEARARASAGERSAGPRL